MSNIKAQNLACPIDGKTLYSAEKQLRCDEGHTYDIARQGYVHLLPVQDKRSKNPGDSKEMVLARTEFLNSGVYEPLAKLLSEQVLLHIYDDRELCILDAGCGEGYYLDFIQQSLKVSDDKKLSFIGLDISKPAIIAAAKRNKQICWVVGTNRQPPIEDNSVDIILCVFGFPSLEGFYKILKSGGLIILVEPGPDHLSELKDIIYETISTKPHEEGEFERHGISLIDTQSIQFRTGVLDNKLINDLLSMTPHLFRATKEGKTAAGNLQELDMSVDIVVRVFEKNVAP